MNENENLELLCQILKSVSEQMRGSLGNIHMALGRLMPAEDEATGSDDRTRSAEILSQSYHRLLRGKEQVHSVLDDIPYVGEKRRAELISHYPDLDSIRNAGVEEMAALPGFDRRAAQSIYDFFHRDGLSKTSS